MPAADIERVAALVQEGETAGDATVTGILLAEPAPGDRLYLCAFEAPDGARSWLAVRDDGSPVADRRLVRDATWIAALCEVAADVAFPGDLEELRGRLLQVRMTEAPPGIEEAEAAALALERVIGAPPHVASPLRLDELGAAARRLETALDPTQPSPFAAAMQGAQGAVEELVREIEGSYRIPLQD
jgi:hypothetical protein